MDYNSAICNDCKSSMAPILYGMPTEEMIEYANQNIIALGGTRIKEYTHYCYSCDEVFVLSSN